MTRTRRPGRPPVAVHRPLYARVLRLRYLAPSGLLCFVLFEGAVALGLLLGLAELVSWWGVLVLPATVALMVKLNDVVAGALIRAATPVRSGPGRPTGDPLRPAGGQLRPAGDQIRPAGDHLRFAGDQVRPGGDQVWSAGDQLRPGAAAGPAATRDLPGEATTRLPGVIEREHGEPIKRPWAERVEIRQQWMRQSATRRYE